MKMDAKALKEVRLFSQLKESEIQALAQLGTVAQFEAHSSIVIEGEMTGGLFLILEGDVGVYKMNRSSGDLIDVGQLHEGDFFGEISLIDENPRSATVRALTECTLFNISRESFLEFINRSGDLKMRFLEGCIRDFIQRLRTLDESFVVSQYQLWKSAIHKESA